jgi:hypothetical protein
MSKAEYHRVEREFQTNKEEVEYILSVDEDSRNSDKRLYSQYLNLLTPYSIINKDLLESKLDRLKITTLDLEQIKNSIKEIINSSLTFNPKTFPNFETIRRNRQKIQNEEERFIPTSQEVAEKRNIREELIRKYFREEKKKKDQLLIH